MPGDRKIVLAGPRGFCAGVRRAVDMMETALRLFPHPVYCLNELVHNTQVVSDLERQGGRFVREVEKVPRGACLLLSAHGVAPAVRRAARQRGLRVLDATCPFVTRLHTAVRRYARRDCHVLLIGNRSHDEIIGICGEAPDRIKIVGNIEDARTVTVPDTRLVAAVSQTTLAVESTAMIMEVLRQRFPKLQTAENSDICFATHHRQQAAKSVAQSVELMLILGSPNSSNTNRLVEVCRLKGRPAFLIGALECLNTIKFDACNVIGLTAGASTPDRFVDQIVDRLRTIGFTQLSEMVTVNENVRFPMPRSLRMMAATPPRGDANATPP